MTVLALNKRAGFDYEILETFNAGLVLSGQEVKSAKAGQASLKGSYVVFRSAAERPQPFLLNARISPYKYAKTESYDPERPRALLLKRREIAYLAGKQQEKGLTLVPLKLYTDRSLIKLEFAVARGKKQFDKRETIKRRDINRRLGAARRTGSISE